MKNMFKKLLFLTFFLPLFALAQSILKGKVTDSENGDSLPGVSVTVQGSTLSTTTEIDGSFILKGVNNGDVIVFSFIGFNTSILTYTGQDSVNFKMFASKQIDEIVVVGYGKVKKKDATGALTQVTSKDFNKGAIATIDQLLQGKAPGVRITTNGGNPDSAPNIRIRGGGSLNANNSPLIVIDGVAIDNTNPATAGNPLGMINPNDVESFTILKDASATAIYGARASNGVLIITTKKGTSGALKMNFSSATSLGRIGKKVDVMTGSEFTRFIQEYHPNFVNSLGVDDPNTNAIDNPATAEVEGRILANTDWQDIVTQTSLATDNNLSASVNLFGKMPVRASIGHNMTEGLLKTNKFERVNLGFKANPQFLKNDLKFDVNVKYSKIRKNVVDEGGVLGGAIGMDPTKPVYDPTSIFGGYFQQTGINGGRNVIDGPSNPLALLNQRSRPENIGRIIANIEADYKMFFLKDLRAVVNFGYDQSDSSIREVFENNAIATYRFDSANKAFFNPGINYLENQLKTSVLLDSYLQYSKNLSGFIKKFDIQGGYSYQNFETKGNKDKYIYSEKTGLRELDFDINNPTNRYFNQLNLQSFFGRANIDLNEKYLLTFTMRADASSLFAKDKRWGYFPSAALAWKLKNESFLKDKNAINDIKLRISWGQTGQQDVTQLDGIGYYPSLPLFEIGSPNSQYLPGFNLYNAKGFNPDITWEKTTTYNAGIDFDLFKNSIISGSFDVYMKETNDLLANITLPPGQFVSTKFVKNVAQTKSRGFELNLNSNLIKNDHATLSINGNLTYNYTKVTDLDGQKFIDAGGGLPTGTGIEVQKHAIGFQPTSFWLLQQLYDTNGKPIVDAYVDRNADGVITNDDRYFIQSTPNWLFGFGLNYSYKNLDFTSSFRGQLGGRIYNTRVLTNGWVDRARPAVSNGLTNVLDFYSGAANPDFKNVNGNIPLSDQFLEDASFLRCESISLGYTFRNIFKSSNHLRFYAAVNNAFLITKYKGQDPENFVGIDTNFYPRPRVYTFGLSYDF